MDLNNMNSEQKLDFLIATMLTMQKSMAKIDELVTRTTQLETQNLHLAERCTSLEKNLSTVSKEVKELKDQNNFFLQSSKSNAVRLFNFPGSNDETNLSAKVFDRILKPIFTAAKTKGDIPSVPKESTVIDSIFRAGRFSPGRNKPPPPIIIKFSSAAHRTAIFKNKRINMPSPSEEEKTLGIKKFIIAEDLTTPTYRKYQELLKDDRVARAWTYDGSIFFVLKGEGKPVVKVKSVFDDLELILS